MGQIVRRKRRGRPSNTDRARINYSAAPPSPVDRRRSRRRRNVRYNFDIDDYVDDDEFYDDEDEEVGRREKKLRLLLSEDDSRPNTRRVRHAPASSSSDDYDDDNDEDVKHSKKRKINASDGEDDEDNEFEEIRGRKLEEEDDEEEEQQEEDEEEAQGGSDFVCGTASDLSKGVPLPDKKTLELILDKLQKKDTYGVYAEPVDPDELPDYHDVIKHPMDFATVRKKLAKGAYLTLKEFESDVYLICTNAMQYNAPDTIYYKQASSIQEQAKLRFQRLRANVDRSEIEPKPNTDHKITPNTFSPPKKQLKKPVGRPRHDPVESETLSGANLRLEEFPNGSSAQTPLRPNPNSNEVLIPENSSLPDNSLDKDQELVPGKGLISKLGRKAVHDENKRATYNTSVEPVTESDSMFSIFEGESKQFIPVGLHADHSYARSLARFAATLGSVAWKVASQTIEQALPAGVKYGRGWVGEYEPLPTSVLIMPGDYTLKETHFLQEKTSASTTHNNNLRKPLKQDSPIKPPFFKFSAPNSLAPPPQVELNHPPPPPPIITRKPVHNTPDIPSPRPSPPVSRNGNLVSMPYPISHNDGFAPGRPSKVHPTPTPIQVSQEQQVQPGLSDPVQMMKMLAERSQSQQNNNLNSFGFESKGSQIGLKREDPSSNVAALTAAQAWMSLGGTGTHKQQIPNDSLYSRNQAPQVSRFRGEVHFQGPQQQQQQPVQAFVPQQVQVGGSGGGGHLQNRHMGLGFPQLVTADLSRFQVQPSWRGVGVTPQQLRPKQQEPSTCPPDLNIGYQSSPVRQSTGMLVDSQQPDLALQL